jgi:hypothetical protein
VLLTCPQCIANSQSYWDDFKLVMKNDHILVSCFAVHREHYFTTSERFYVLLVSIFWAFFLSALFALAGRVNTCEQVLLEEYGTCEAHSVTEGGSNLTTQVWSCKYANGSISMTDSTEYKNKFDECFKDKTIKPTMDFVIVFSIISSLIQIFYDTLATFLVTCGCVQTCPSCIKNCAEALGKMAFYILAVVGVVFLIVGLVLISDTRGDVAVAICSFLITKLLNFVLVTTLILLVTFDMARRAQMKPPASTLETPQGRAKWEEKPTDLWTRCLTGLTCASSVAPCDLWNKHIGADKSFEDLPLSPPDYDWSLKVCGCSTPLYEYKATNPQVCACVCVCIIACILYLVCECIRSFIFYQDYNFIAFLYPTTLARARARALSLSVNANIISSHTNTHVSLTQIQTYTHACILMHRERERERERKIEREGGREREKHRPTHTPSHTHRR